MQDKDFDRFIREALNNQQEPAYNPADWDMLEDRLANFNFPQAQPASNAAGVAGGGMAKLGFVASAVLFTVLNTVAILKPGIFENKKQEVVAGKEYQAVSLADAEKGQNQTATEATGAPALPEMQEVEIQQKNAVATLISSQEESNTLAVQVNPDKVAVRNIPAKPNTANSKAKPQPANRKGNAQTLNLPFNNPGNLNNASQAGGSSQSLNAGKPGAVAVTDCNGNLKPELAYLLSGTDTLRSRRLSLTTCQDLSLRLIATDKDGDKVSISSNIADVLPGAKLTMQENSSVVAEWKATPAMARQQPYNITFWLTDKRCAGAEPQSFQVAVSVTPAFVVSLNSAASLEKGQPTVLEVVGAPRGSSFRWFNQNGMLGNAKSSRLEARPVNTTTYRVQVISPAGCVATDSAKVEVVDADLFANSSQSRFIPNIITPNADGINDYFETKLPENGPLKLAIFDRWGKQVYYQENYQNNWNASDLPAGIYYYTLTAGQNNKPYKGWVEVVR